MQLPPPPPPVAPPPPAPVATAVPLWRSLAVLGLAAATVAICYWSSPPTTKAEPGVVMNLPSIIGAFYGKDEPISEAETVILPKDTQFAKKLYSDGRGDEVNCQIVLAGAEKRSIHRPEICLPGQGWTLKSEEVIPVQLASGKTLKVTNLTITRPYRGRELTAYYIYWFVGKNVTTPSHVVRILKTNLDMLLHNTNHRWAYVIVSSPILEGLQFDGKNGPQTLDMLKDFISKLAPKIMKSEGATE